MGGVSTTVRLLVRDEQDTRWMADAACRTQGKPEDWFPTALSGVHADAAADKAKAICGRCPVLDSCREWALQVQEWGIAGGLTEEERRTVRRARSLKSGAR